MWIRTFTGATVTEAMAEVRRALGPDAIILSTRKASGGKGIELRAAIEDMPLADLRRDLDLPASGSAPRADEHERVRGAIEDALRRHGTTERLAQDLARAAGSMIANDDGDALAGALEARLAFDPLPSIPVRPVALVGPPGVGKTSTAAKLAARAALTGAPLSLITTDTQRAGAVEQLRYFADILSAPLSVADSPAALRSECARLSGTVFFIDTPGINPFDTADVAELATFLAAADIEPVLVLSAGQDAMDMADMARIYADVGCRRMIVTRIDTTRRLGGILSAADSAAIATAHFGVSPYVAKGLASANAAMLARLILAAPAENSGFTQRREQAAQ
jgi:flagellar biosynthesis protein FlhF